MVGSVLGAKDREINKIVKIPASDGSWSADAIPFSQIVLLYCLQVLSLFEVTLFLLLLIVLDTVEGKLHEDMDLICELPSTQHI